MMLTLFDIRPSSSIRS